MVASVGNYWDWEQAGSSVPNTLLNHPIRPHGRLWGFLSQRESSDSRGLTHVWPGPQAPRGPPPAESTLSVALHVSRGEPDGQGGREHIWPRNPVCSQDTDKLEKARPALNSQPLTSSVQNHKARPEDTRKCAREKERVPSQSEAEDSISWLLTP